MVKRILLPIRKVTFGSNNEYGPINVTMLIDFEFENSCSLRKKIILYVGANFGNEFFVK